MDSVQVVHEQLAPLQLVQHIHVEIFFGFERPARQRGDARAKVEMRSRSNLLIEDDMLLGGHRASHHRVVGDYDTAFVPDLSGKRNHRRLREEEHGGYLPGDRLRCGIDLRGVPVPAAIV